uniref:Uncharacterized protein n=1 Tax=Malurus cyaneus samueli TaxID=2593467 RepID=A0A8C5TJE9_9PASS
SPKMQVMELQTPHFWDPPFPCRFWGCKPRFFGARIPTFGARIPFFWGRFPSSQHLLETPFGVMHAWVSGSPRPGRPALVTFPDVGHTHRTCFSELFGHEEMREIARSFHLVHLEPPGMEEGAPPYPPGYQYPSLEQLAEALPGVLQGLG